MTAAGGTVIPSAAIIAGGADFVAGAPDVTIGGDPAATYVGTLNDVLAAWRQPGALEREVGLPRGQRRPASLTVWIHLGETVTHGWDLARATDQDPGFDDGLVGAVLAYARSTIPPQRGEQSPFADARTVEGLALIDELAAYLGRDVGSLVT